MALNGIEGHIFEEKGTEFDYQCGQNLLTRQVKEKKNRTIKEAAKQVPRDKATPSLAFQRFYMKIISAKNTRFILLLFDVACNSE